jgi:sulfur carrier protein
MSGSEIRVNGGIEALVPTVAALLAAKGLAGAKGLAVAVNEVVVPRSSWAGTVLRAGDEVEIVRAVGGG